MRFVATTVVPAQRAFRRGDDEEAMRRFSEGVMGKAAAEASAPEELEAMRDNVTSARAQLLGKGFPPLRDDDVRRVEVPTLLVTGRETPAFLRLLSDRLAELLPHAEGVEIPDASHCMQVDQPERTNAALLGFLARHEATA
jgi:pimeloyl-ACP methyl ester carboxylesterase